MKSDLTEILVAFGCSPEVAVRTLGGGNINQTYLVHSTPGPFVLQQISSRVFPDPTAVIENFGRVYRHFISLAPNDTSGFIMAGPISTKENALGVVDTSGAYWRAQRYIETHRVQTVDGPEQLRSIGRTLARFHLLFKDLALKELKDPLPGFHKLPLYLASYDSHCNNTVFDLDRRLAYCHKVVLRHREQAGILEEVRQQGELQVQPIHGDPKLDNFIYDGKGCGVGMLDLDTVAGGIVYHDLGDCLRSVCSMSGESIADKNRPGFDLDRCEWMLEGYFSGGTKGGNLHPELIYSGLLAICFELAVRFFTDHLQGNIYFRVEQDGENLIKAEKQFLLCEEIVKLRDKILKRIEIILTINR